MGCIWAWQQLRCNIPNVFGFVNRSTMFPALTGTDISRDNRTSEEKTIHILLCRTCMYNLGVFGQIFKGKPWKAHLYDSILYLSAPKFRDVNDPFNPYIPSIYQIWLNHFSLYFIAIDLILAISWSISMVSIWQN